MNRRSKPVHRSFGNISTVQEVRKGQVREDNMVQKILRVSNYFYDFSSMASLKIKYKIA